MFDPRLNVFAGGNGAGKTSLLEAIFVLGRGRSFRAADMRVLVRTGAESAEVSGAVAGPVPLGIRLSGAGQEIRVGGQPASATDLASLLPVQAIHAEIAGIVQGAPEVRRRLLDWGVFHVEQQYLRDWRAYRRSVSQRNAALREADAPLAPWDLEVARAGAAVDEHRRAYLAGLAPEFRRIGQDLLGVDVDLHYQRGWASGEELLRVLESSHETDRAAGYTRSGPHRADLQIRVDAERSRWRASKGEQKLLGASLVLAQCQLVSERLASPVALLVDEPSADLDGEHLGQLIKALKACPAQLFIAALNPGALPELPVARTFHVEHGKAKALL